MNKNIEFGFTLIELIVCIAIISIVISLAIPTSKHLLARMEAKKVVSTLTTLITYNKHHAYLYQQRVGMCSSTDGINCSTSSWSNSILVFKDSNFNRNRDSEETLIQLAILNLKHGTLTWKGAQGRNLNFQPDSGLPRGSNGSFYYCSDDYPDLHRKLVLSDMGHLRTEKLTTC